jgi:hypothetical protein
MRPTQDWKYMILHTLLFTGAENTNTVIPIVTFLTPLASNSEDPKGQYAPLSRFIFVLEIKIK